MGVGGPVGVVDVGRGIGWEVWSKEDPTGVAADDGGRPGWGSDGMPVPDSSSSVTISESVGRLEEAFGADGESTTGRPFFRLDRRFSGSG